MLITALWEVDRTTDEVKVHARSLKAAVDQAQTRIEANEQTLQSLEAERAALTERERDLQKTLDRYVLRRDRSAALMEGGSPLDYLIVQKQHEQCSAKVEELEDGVMDCMEKQEDLAERLRALSEESTRAQQHHEQVITTWKREGQEIRVKLKQLGTDRDARWAACPRDMHSHYSDLRRRKRDVVVPLLDGLCSGCHMTLTAQVSVDLRSSRRIHTCRGCGRYLILPVDEAPDEA